MWISFGCRFLSGSDRCSSDSFSGDLSASVRSPLLSLRSRFVNSRLSGAVFTDSRAGVFFPLWLSLPIISPVSVLRSCVSLSSSMSFSDTWRLFAPLSSTPSATLSAAELSKISPFPSGLSPTSSEDIVLAKIRDDLKLSGSESCLCINKARGSWKKVSC